MELTEQDFVKIINENNDRLKHLSRVYSDRKDEAEDLYQEILIQIWRSLPSFKGDAKISTWVYRIGINTGISFARKKQTRHNYYGEYKKEQQSRERDLGSAVHGPEEDEQVEALYNAINTLNASEKAIISMYLEGFSYAEISYAMDITENYVGVKLNRIKKQLTDLLGD